MPRSREGSSLRRVTLTGRPRCETRDDPTNVILRLSDPAYLERLVAFLDSVGQRGMEAEGSVVALEREIPEEELRIYLRVWSVLYPEAPVSVE